MNSLHCFVSDSFVVISVTALFKLFVMFFRLSTSEEEIPSDEDGSYNSEDDPDRLWCICQKPHNNR